MNRSDLPPAHDAIEEAAVQWLIERDEGFGPGRAGDFARWRAARPEHAAAVARLEETWSLLEELPDLQPVPVVRPSAAAPDRRSRAALWLPLSAAAALVLAVAWWRLAPPSPETRYATGPHQVERVALPDGSVVTLNGSSEIRVRYEGAERRVALAAGEAHFAVAADPARPFLVTAEGVTARAVGTAFSVRVAAAAVEVVVSEGKVRLLDTRAPVLAAPVEPPAPLLEAGDRAVVSRAAARRTPTVTRLEPQALRETLAWQQEMLVFADTPLREVIAQFNRHNRLQLRLGEPELGERLIGGTFAVGNVASFVTLLERGGDLTLERNGEGEVILRKAR